MYWTNLREIGWKENTSHLQRTRRANGDNC
jgi:hypothetical protein